MELDNLSDPLPSSIFSVLVCYLGIRFKTKVHHSIPLGSILKLGHSGEVIYR
jgi:hypothetical protein